MIKALFYRYNYNEVLDWNIIFPIYRTFNSKSEQMVEISLMIEIWYPIQQKIPFSVGQYQYCYGREKHECTIVSFLSFL